MFVGNFLKRSFSTAVKAAARKGQISQVSNLLSRSLVPSWTFSSKERFLPSSTLSKSKESKTDSFLKSLSIWEILELELSLWIPPKDSSEDKKSMILVPQSVFPSVPKPSAES